MEEEKQSEVIAIPPTSSSTTFEDFASLSSYETPPCIDSLEETYQVTQNLNNKLKLACLFADYKPISFGEVAQNEKTKTKRRNTIEVEINAIQKNDSWELTTLPTRHTPIKEKWMHKIRKKSLKIQCKIDG